MLTTNRFGGKFIVSERALTLIARLCSAKEILSSNIFLKVGVQKESYIKFTKQLDFAYFIDIKLITYFHTGRP